MTTPQPRASILEIQPYKGGEGRLGDFEHPVRLASNENPLGCSPFARAAYLKAGDDLNRYPDGGVGGLREALGKTYDMNPARIVCGAGSDELIGLLTRAYAGAGDEVVYSQYGFLMYPIAAKAVGAIPVAAPEKDFKTDINAVLAAVTEKTKLVFIANPNNPTGSYLTTAEMEMLAENLPKHVVLVIDAAYAEFVEKPDYSDGRELVDIYDNVVMLRTFSKIHGLAAVRLGWGYFPAGIADIVNRVRGPFNVNAPAQAAGIAALEDKNFIRETINLTNAGIEYLSREIAALGFDVLPSVGNFLLIKFGAKAEIIRQELNARGVFIRQMGAYGLPEHLRITVGLEGDNQKVVAALKEISASL